MRKAMLFATLLLAVVVLSGCRIQVVEITELDDGGARIAETGDRILIRLAGNPTTGYTWIRTAPEDLCGTPLDTIEEGTCTAPDQCGLVGTGGDFLFEYRASSPGVVDLAFVYQRPWEDEPIKTFVVTVWVR